MLLSDLPFVLKDYRHLPKNKKNKALHSKIKYIPSEAAFSKTMYKLGITQRKKQYALLVNNMDYFKRYKHQFFLNNTLRLSKDTIVFADKIDESKFNIPKGLDIDIYTRKYKSGISSSRNGYLDIVFIKDNEIFIINPIVSVEV